MQRRTKVVFAGAGHTTMVALNQLRRDADVMDVVVVSDGPRSFYSGMVPGWIEGIYADDAMAISVEPVVRRAGGRFRVGRIEGATADALWVDGEAIPFDVLVLNTGSASRLPGPLAGPHVIAARPIRSMIERIAAPLSEAASFAVVGGGVAGVEVAISLKARRPDAAVALVEKGEAILPGLPDAFRRHVLKVFDRLGIAAWQGVGVAAVDRAGLTLATGERVAAACTVALTGAAPPDWLADTPFEKAADGFVAVDATLRSPSHPNVFAVGDVSTRTADPRPKAGVFAVRSGPHVATALRRVVRGEAPAPVTLQRRGLVLATTGHRRAVGTRNGITLSGRWVWRLKDRLDRSFVERFRTRS